MQKLCPKRLHVIKYPIVETLVYGAKSRVKDFKIAKPFLFSYSFINIDRFTVAKCAKRNWPIFFIMAMVSWVFKHIKFYILIMWFIVYLLYLSKAVKKNHLVKLTKINTVSKSWLSSSHVQSYGHPIVWLLKIVYSLINKLEKQNGVSLTHKIVEDPCCVCNIFPFFKV